MERHVRHFFTVLCFVLLYNATAQSTPQKEQQPQSSLISDTVQNHYTPTEESTVLAPTQIQAQDSPSPLVLISLMVALLCCTGLVYAYLKHIKSQRLVTQQKRVIESACNEKDVLLKEVHHRVKNNLQILSSLLSLQIKNTANTSVIEALKEGKSRVKAMALIHEQLYQRHDLSVIAMQDYIKSLATNLRAEYKKGKHPIRITIDAEGTEVDLDQAIPLGLILNELLSNAFKYAFPNPEEKGEIYIHLQKGGKQHHFEYTDNGVGLPKDIETRIDAAMGIRLMNRLVQQLHSQLHLDKTTRGVRFWFTFNG